MIFILYLVLTPVLSAIKLKEKVETMYVLSGKANLRSDPEVNSFKTGQYKYGQEVKAFKKEDGWVNVSVEGKKGYISTSLLATPKEFHIVESIFGTKESEKKLKKTVYKKALARYFLENNYISNIPDETVGKYWASAGNQEMWQIFCVSNAERFNAVATGDFDGDKLNDAAFVLKNLDTEKNRLIIISFDKEKPDEISKVIYSMDFDDDFSLVRLIRRGNRMYLNGSEIQEIKPNPKRTTTKVDALLIGTNRNKSFNDHVNLLIYDGENFVLHSQDIKKKEKK